MREVRTWKADETGTLLWAQVFFDHHRQVSAAGYEKYWVAVDEPVLVNTSNTDIRSFAKYLLDDPEKKRERREDYEAYVLDDEVVGGTRIKYERD